MMNNRHFLWLFPILSASMLLPTRIAQALTITDKFNGTTTAYNWLQPLAGDGTANSVCLTAGTATSSPPRCPRLNDPVGSGVLRLTDAQGSQHGAIVSDFTFATGAGIQVTFDTYTYGGTGADGMTFFLADGAQPATIGGTGGSLGYSCSNVNGGYNGVKGGYIGLGMDEWGNFLNRGDNTATGYITTTTGTTTSDNTVQAANTSTTLPGRIGLRGVGDVNWDSLNTRFPAQFPAGSSAATKRSLVQAACKAGTVNVNGQQVSIDDYKTLAVKKLPTGTPIGNQVDTPTHHTCDTNGTNCVRLGANGAKRISYKLKITPDGFLSFWWSYDGGQYQPLLANQNIIATNGALPASFRFGFTGSTGGATNIHEIACFQAAPANASNDSASVSLPTGQYKTGAQLYLASYLMENSWGQLKSTNLLKDSSGNVSVSPTSNWDASCVLTGGNCSQPSATNITAQTPGSRQIVTWDGSTGIAFTWSSLTTNQQTALNATVTDGYDDPTGNHGQQRVNYLRGSRTDEITSTGVGLFRQRTGVLGDIVNSSPVWVGPPSAALPTSSYSIETAWKDSLYPSATINENAATAQTYGAFQTASGTRTNLVYVGANDGFLHAFRSGYYDASGNYHPNNTSSTDTDTSVPNDGREMFAYMPSSILNSIHSTNSGLDFSSPQYGHNYFVDETPGTGDLFYNNAWHTWLVGGLGFGGQSIYAIDITDPSLLTESNASNIVIGEWAFDAATTSVWNKLGKTYGTPIIRRLHNGQWAIIFGNGWCLPSDTTTSSSGATTPNCSASSNGHAGIYILPVNTNGTVSTTPIFLDTGAGTTAAPNGIASVASADLDGDHITDYIYAGDLAGNVWRFDLTSATSSSWAASSNALFMTGGQPITTQLTVSSSKAPTESKPRIIINFGTGEQLPQTINTAATYATPTQDLYGIWDWDMGSWNTNSATKYAALTATTTPAAPTGSSVPLQKTDLKQQQITTSGTAPNITRALSSDSVCWKDLTACSAGTNTKYGWYTDLSSTTVGTTTVYEQVIYNPIVIDGALIVNTTIPPNNSPLTCTTEAATGWTIPVDPATGVGLPGFFSGNSADSAGYAANLNGTGTPSVVDVNGQPVLVTQTTSGTPTVKKIYPKATGTRINWIQLR